MTECCQWEGLLIGLRADTPENLARLLGALPLGYQISSAEEVDMLFSLRGGIVRSRSRDFLLLFEGSRRLARSLDMAEVTLALGDWLRWRVAGKGGPKLLLRGELVGEELRLGRGHCLVDCQRVQAEGQTFTVIRAGSGRRLLQGGEAALEILKYAPAFWYEPFRGLEQVKSLVLDCKVWV